ncbi:hypothetical protein TKK_0018894 [Trichogramma kaykai]
MTGDAVGNLVEVTRKLNSIQYVQILDNWFYPYIGERYPFDEKIFVVEDNNLVHRAGIVRQWFKDYPKIVRQRHLVRSPCINVTENLWAYMTRAWRPENSRTRIPCEIS